MNIYAKRGAQVVFDHPNNGYSHDMEKCSKLLVIGKNYTIDHTNVYDSSTTVFLQEFPGEHFNSVMFSDAKE